MVEHVGTRVTHCSRSRWPPASGCDASGRWRAAQAHLLTLPFIAVLVTPAPPGFGSSQSGWTAVIAAVAIGWVSVAELDCPPHRIRADATTLRVPTSRPSAPHPRVGWRGCRPVPRWPPRWASGSGWPSSLGHQLFPQHWPWMVLTAYIVASGNRGRGDVVYKSGLRLRRRRRGHRRRHAAVPPRLPAGNRRAVVAIFAVVVVVSTLLRTANYAYWVAGVTAALAFLYGYSGQTGAEPARHPARGDRVRCRSRSRQRLVRPADPDRASAAPPSCRWTHRPQRLHSTATRRRDLEAVGREQERFEAALEQVEQACGRPSPPTTSSRSRSAVTCTACRRSTGCGPSGSRLCEITALRPRRTWTTCRVWLHDLRSLHTALSATCGDASAGCR